LQYSSSGGCCGSMCFSARHHRDSGIKAITRIDSQRAWCTE
jgi:hypothetical protein